VCHRVTFHRRKNVLLDQHRHHRPNFSTATQVFGKPALIAPSERGKRSFG
jgi:hypothetical protein